MNIDYNKLSPMMKEYMDLKKEHMDAFLFYRLGDFYEMFFHDALLGSKELEITLTGRDCGLEDRAPMCGVPVKSVDLYINKLLSKGYKVAICEQLEDPKKATGMVKRGLTRVITPGTNIDTFNLESKENNYLFVGSKLNKNYSFIIADIIIGEFIISKSIREEEFISELFKYAPKEIVINGINLDLLNEYKRLKDVSITNIEEYIDLNEKKEKYILDKIKECRLNLDIDGLENINKKCLYMFFKYGEETLINTKVEFNNVTFYEKSKYLEMDSRSRRNLEITENIISGDKKSTLYSLLDVTKTSGGSRYLKHIISSPLLNINEIEKRLEFVEEIVEEPILLDKLRDYLKSVYDIERLIGKLSLSNGNGRILLSLMESIRNLPFIKEELSNLKSLMGIEISNNIDTLEDIFNLIDKGINLDCPITIKEGGIIKEGFSSELDSILELKNNGENLILELEERERESTGIKSLKIGYNKVFGYFLDVRNTYKDLVPDYFIRKQTLASSERYITRELEEIEGKLSSSSEKANELEYEIFLQIRNEILKRKDDILRTSRYLSKLDCFLSISYVSLKNNYTKPVLKKNGELIIKGGRHPVVEKSIKENYIKNDLNLGGENNKSIIITGPNMAGKSTYMRQTAIIVIMAQMGSFTPADYSEIPIIDKIFTRIGASDDLGSGKSTFMVEMSEVSLILKNATSSSLILLDEIGRGTSTYDGLSLAKAVVEYIYTNIHSLVLFATHYHELISMESEFKGIKNLSMEVSEKDGEIVFLRSVIEGGASKSYGINVASLAGLPNKVVERAKEILKSLDRKKETAYIEQSLFNFIDNSNNIKSDTNKLLDENKESKNSTNISRKEEEVLSRLKELDIDDYSPRELVGIVEELQNILN